MTFTDIDDVTVDPVSARVYEHGWQSWSPAAVYPVDATSARPDEAWQQLMRFRPGAPLPESGFQAEGLLVVDPGAGEPARSYVAADPASEVPTLRARLLGDRLVVSTDRPDLVATSTAGALETALEEYGDRVLAESGEPPRPAPTAWCSWYRYFLDVTEADVVENLESFDLLELPVDVVQVDDGWQVAVGDWLDLSPRFSSLRDLADRIRDRGRRAGIWVAPFTVAQHSRLADEHPSWLMPGGGTNWGGDIAGLDLTHPEVRQHLDEVFGRLRDIGFDYFKLDFLYTGALPGPRHDRAGDTAAYRSGLQLVRDAVGPEAYLLGCGAPMLPSVGLVDAMRVSPDTYHPGTDLIGELRGRANVEARAWQQGRLWVNDADCLVARPSFPRRAEWAEVVGRHSGLRSFSDRVSDLDEWGLRAVRRHLERVPEPVPF